MIQDSVWVAKFTHLVLTRACHTTFGKPKLYILNQKFARRQIQLAQLRAILEQDTWYLGIFARHPRLSETRSLHGNVNFWGLLQRAHLKLNFYTRFFTS